MAVKIRLKRLGKIRAPYYRVVVADARTKRDGRAIEEIGKYHPTQEPSLIDIDSDRAQYWLSVGAQPTEQVLALLKVTGDWQKFKGLPGAEGTLKSAAPKSDKKAVFEAAAKESLGDTAGDGATTPRKRAAKKAAAPEAAAAETAAPEVAAPEVAAPEVAAPEAAAPEAAAPEAATPEAATPGATAAEVAAPETATPEATAAEVAAPEADAADEGAPGGSETSEQTAIAAETAPAEG